MNNGDRTSAMAGTNRLGRRRGNGQAVWHGDGATVGDNRIDDALRTMTGLGESSHDSRAVQASREQIRRHYHSQPLHRRTGALGDIGCCARRAIVLLNRCLKWTGWKGRQWWLTAESGVVAVATTTVAAIHKAPPSSPIEEGTNIAA